MLKKISTHEELLLVMHAVRMFDVFISLKFELFYHSYKASCEIEVIYFDNQHYSKIFQD